MSDSIDGPTDLYRYYDADDRLLYVGISFSAVARASQHRQDKGWWPDVAKMTVEHMPSRSDALAAERVAISLEKPIHNVMGNNGPSVIAAPWRCEACRRGIGLKKQDGFIQANRDAEWHCFCVKCDPEPTPRYWIDAQRIATLEDIDQWTTHLSGKRWFEQSTWVYMVRKCSTLPQASTRAFLAFDAHRDEQRRKWLRHSA